MKLVKLLANLGYGSRSQVESFLRKGVVTDTEGRVLGSRDFPPHAEILFKGEPLDPPAPLTLMFHKPAGYTCSTDDPGDTIYDLLPVRYALRNPVLSPVGRLDKDTTGLLLMTDDGQLLHRLISPKHHVPKTYHVTLDRPIEGHEAALFASGELVLRGEDKPLLPATMEALGEKEARITLEEGRYHQVRRMFAAAGNHVVELKRVSIGGLALPDDLEEGEWRTLGSTELAVAKGG
ncbi:pseudouridine synthase [Luteolibacter flavescens]|uniref:Pseudouridine synthase n=1 Tax=Luteolibacter flavescens TaxID=1859460 RepID=A0ABT3FV43_9BACT|nr:16S rRNA pseudouridine(516) synthase [Luteolibacter flavescens]MCW1887074.1 pseudouridine synthase [Luteolibacter flavescens]